MIYTRFGSKVAITKGNLSTGKVIVKREDGTLLNTDLMHLKASNGFSEIMDAVQELNKRGLIKR